MNFFGIIHVVILGFLASLVTKLLAPEDFSNLEFAFANGVVLMGLVFGMDWVLAVLSGRSKKRKP
jgi:cation transporter-like permease